MRRGLHVAAGASVVALALAGASVNSAHAETLIDSIPLPAWTSYGVAIDPAGQFAYVANQESTNVSKIKLADDTVTSIAMAYRTNDVAVSATGHHAYFTNGDGAGILKLDTTDDSVSAIALDHDASGIAVDATHTYAYTGDSNNETVTRIDLSDDSTVSVHVGAPVYGVALNPAGTIVYTANFDAGTVSRVNFADSSVKTTRIGPAGSTDSRHVAVNPAGTRVIATGVDHALSVIRVGPGPKPALATGKASAKITRRASCSLPA